MVGLKPSYGRVSRYGLVAFASSLDQIGPLTRNVEDAALLLQAIAGLDPRDSTCLDVPVPDYLADLDDGVKGLKLGVPRNTSARASIRRCEPPSQAAIERLAAAGAELVEISLPHTEYAVATYYIIAPAEASSNLSRFDGIRYGHRADNPPDILDLYRRSREEGFGPEVKRRIILGTYVLSFRLLRRLLQPRPEGPHPDPPRFRAGLRAGRRHPLPGRPHPGRRIGSNADPLQEYLSDIFTLSANLAGICGISVPCGTVEADGASGPPRRPANPRPPPRRGDHPPCRPRRRAVVKLPGNRTTPQDLTFQPLSDNCLT